MESVAICVFLTAVCLMFFGLFWQTDSAKSRQREMDHECIMAREKECALNDSDCFSQVLWRCQYIAAKP